MRIINKDSDEPEPEWADKNVKLENMAVDPFDNWSDWYGENGEVVITFMTMDAHLLEEWQNQARNSDTLNHATYNGKPLSKDERVEIFTHNDFENDFRGPGIYRDDHNISGEEKVDESYTIIVPTDFMTQDLCEKYIERLNEEFNRNFELEKVDVAKRKAEMHSAFIGDEVEEDKETIEKIVKKVYKS